MLTLGETGVAGLATFVLAFGSAFYTLSRARSAAAGDAVAYPIVIAATAVLIVTVVHGMMDVYWRRGVGVLGWACVGMAVQFLQTQSHQAAAFRVPMQLPRRSPHRFTAGSQP